MPSEPAKPASQGPDFVTSMAYILQEMMDWLQTVENDSVKPVLVGGYAHMSFFQKQNLLYRTLGCHEYGLRDIDLVLVPLNHNWDEYSSASQRMVDCIDSLLNARASSLRRGVPANATYLELTQVSSDYAVQCKKVLNSFHVQRMLRPNEYGSTYVYRLDSHQLVNVTILSQRHFGDKILYGRSWLIFPAWKPTIVHGETVYSRRIFYVDMVKPSYIKHRLDMQMRTCEMNLHDKMMQKKKLVLQVRKSLWDDPTMRWTSDWTRWREHERIKIEESVREEYERRETIQSNRVESIAPVKVTLECGIQTEEAVQTSVEREPSRQHVASNYIWGGESMASREKSLAKKRMMKKNVRHVMCGTESIQLAPFVQAEWTRLSFAFVGQDFMIILLVLLISFLSWCLK